MNALQALTDVDRDAVVEWLRDCAVDARHDEQDVGIFGNERMAAAFDELAEIVAAQVDTLPKGRDAKQGSVGTKGSAVAEGHAPNLSSPSHIPLMNKDKR